MDKKIRADVTIFLIVAAVILSSLGTYFVINRKITNLTEIQAMYSKLRNLDMLVEEHYINGVDSETLSDAIARGFVEGLGDPYATYYTKSEYKEYQSKLSGEYEGIGLVVSEAENAGLLVTKVYKGSPAADAGVRVGDVITIIGGQTTQSLGYEQALLLMSGDVGSSITFTVSRDGKNVEFDIIRREFDQITVEYTMLSYLGYIRITGFNALTPDYFGEAVDDLLSQGAKGFIFDVRGNGGGLIESVVDVVDRLIGKGVVATSVRKGDENTSDGANKTIYEAETNQEVDLPMVVLADGNTASGGELFTKALMDYEKAEFIGQTTYGKGTGQTTYKLADGSYLKLTDFTYYPPSGETYNIIGISPDIAIKLTAEQEENAYFLDFVDDPFIIAAFEYFGADISSLRDAGSANELYDGTFGDEDSSSGESGSDSSGEESGSDSEASDADGEND